MKIRFLLLGTSLSFIPSLAFSQCVATQNCATLGYTETYCPNGNGVKCPFGNKWFCFKTESEYEQNFCDKYGFTLVCNGENQSPGSKACNSKYNYCSCAAGYDWKDGACQERQPNYTGCTIGALFYSDNTCSDINVSGKTILGVVIMDKTTYQMGWIMTIKPIRTGIAWSTEYVDIPEVLTTSSESELTDIQASCTNTDAITAYANSSKYPAAWAAKNYNPSGTPRGKTWSLPSGGLLKNALDNQTNLDRINTGISTAGGKKIGFGSSYDYELIWSSSEYTNRNVWVFDTYKNGLFNMHGYPKSFNDDYYSVRPVLAF